MYESIWRKHTLTDHSRYSSRRVRHTTDTQGVLHKLSCTCVREYACAQRHMTCRTRDTPASSHISPCSSEVLTSPACHACGCASPCRARFWSEPYGENIGVKHHWCARHRCVNCLTDLGCVHARCNYYQHASVQTFDHHSAHCRTMTGHLTHCHRTVMLCQWMQPLNHMFAAAARASIKTRRRRCKLNMHSQKATQQQQ